MENDHVTNNANAMFISKRYQLKIDFRVVKFWIPELVNSPDTFPVSSQTNVYTNGDRVIDMRVKIGELTRL